MGGCASPGSPLLRTSTDDGEGPLVPDCENVSSAAKVTKRITNFYLSTYGSAFAEGGNEGFAEVVRQATKKTKAGERGVAGLSGGRGIGSETVNHLPFQLSPYCRVYAASHRDISRMIAEILPLLGNKILVSNETIGVFVTDYMERQHLVARWRDSYEITVTSEGSTRTVVHILRKLYISRAREVFNQAISNGHNEAWIMTQVAERLGVQRGNEALRDE